MSHLILNNTRGVLCIRYVGNRHRLSLW